MARTQSAAEILFHLITKHGAVVDRERKAPVLEVGAMAYRFPGGIWEAHLSTHANELVWYGSRPDHTHKGMWDGYEVPNTAPPASPDDFTDEQREAARSAMEGRD